MLKMERSCNSLKCDVLSEGELIGYMEGVNLIQWFLKNKYSFKGSFSNFVTLNREDCRAGMTVDVIFKDKKLIARDAKIEWINAFGTNGTFHSLKMEYYDDSME